MKLKATFIKWLFVLLLVLPGISKANLFVNGDFETNGQAWACNVAPDGWTSNGVQWTNVGNPSYWVDLTDCGFGNGGWVEQTVATIPGSLYQIDFDLLAPQWCDGSIDLYINGAYAGHFTQWNTGLPGLNWGSFNLNYIATGCNTTIRFVANSTCGASTNVVGLDNASIIGPPGAPALNLNATSDCAPSVLSYSPAPSSHWVNWYYNGSLITSNTTSINATSPGTYRLEYINACGDIVFIDKVIKDCDPCEPRLDARYFCFERPTEFELDFSECGLDCISEVTIVYGDGNSDAQTGPAMPFLFQHQYTAPGTYDVLICWLDQCTGKQTCIKRTVVIDRDCDPCKPYFEFKNLCPEDETSFKLHFPKECEECIGKVTIDYGDGSSESTGGTPVEFHHQYGTAGVYNVRICVENHCTGEYKCYEMEVVISDDCDPCAPELKIIRRCFREKTLFRLTFPEDEKCKDCINDFEIDFGDGNVQYGNTSQTDYYNTYPAPGVYYARICWTNHCTGEYKCIIRKVIIRNCKGDDDGDGGGKGKRERLGINNAQPSLYPNPTENSFTIDGLQGDNKLQILDLSGKVLRSAEISGDRISIDVHDLPAGAYIVRIRGDISKEFKLFRQ